MTTCCKCHKKLENKREYFTFEFREIEIEVCIECAKKIGKEIPKIGKAIDELLKESKHD